MIVKYKPGIKKGEDLNPLLEIVASYFLLFCQVTPHLNNQCIVTSTNEEVDGRVSTTHRDNRARDFSSHAFSDKDIADCIIFMNHHVGHLGAFSKSDGKQRVIIHHDIGLGQHFHVQVRPLSTTYARSLKTTKH